MRHDLFYLVSTLPKKKRYQKTNLSLVSTGLTNQYQPCHIRSQVHPTCTLMHPFPIFTVNNKPMKALKIFINHHWEHMLTPGVNLINAFFAMN